MKTIVTILLAAISLSASAQTNLILLDTAAPHTNAIWSTGRLTVSGSFTNQTYTSTNSAYVSYGDAPATAYGVINNNFLYQTAQILSNTLKVADALALTASLPGTNIQAHTITSNAIDTNTWFLMTNGGGTGVSDGGITNAYYTNTATIEATADRWLAIGTNSFGGGSGDSTNGLAGTNYVWDVVIAATNALASTNYVNAATNGLAGTNYIAPGVITNFNTGIFTNANKLAAQTFAAYNGTNFIVSSNGNGTLGNVGFTNRAIYATTVGLGTNSTTYGLDYNSSGNNFMRFQVNASERLRFIGDGSFTRQYVGAFGLVAGNACFVFNKNSAAANAFFGEDSDTGGWGFRAGGTGSFYSFGNYSAPSLYLKCDTKKTGINTNGPLEALHVHGNVLIVSNLVVNRRVEATNFWLSTPRWVDALASGLTLAEGVANAPELADLPGAWLVQPGQGYRYGHGDYASFEIQSGHVASSTNATSLPNFYYEPHVHISVANTNAGTNATFVLEWKVGNPLTGYEAPLIRTNTFGFPATNYHGILSFGAVTNNNLQGKASIMFRGSIRRVASAANDIGSGLAPNQDQKVFVESVDYHIPVRVWASASTYTDE